jgi:hypothetical protein
MSRFRFRSSDGREVTPEQWYDMWANRYPANDYADYGVIIANYKSFSPRDFEQIGKWKDNGKTPSKWKPNVASVAYPIWIQASVESPQCPNERDVAAFLNDWAGRKYTDCYATGQVEKRFGLSRATTILHFLSRGRYPIFDSRVRTALARLLGSTVPNTVGWYLDSYCPVSLEIAALCGTEDLRRMDMALFSYGARKLPFSN